MAMKYLRFLETENQKNKMLGLLSQVSEENLKIFMFSFFFKFIICGKFIDGLNTLDKNLN